jgi:hypothetical protein
MVVQCKSVLFLQFTVQQQALVDQNEENLRQAGLWNYLHTTWDDAIGQDRSLPAVNQFVASSAYCTAYEGVVGKTVLKFTTKELSDILTIPEGGIAFSDVVPLTLDEKKQIFGPGVKRGKEGWNGTKAMGVMAGWIPYISQRFFLNMDEKKIDDKYVAAAFRAWNGTRINWAEILIVNIRKEINRKKTRNPMFILSAGYLNVYCKSHLESNLDVLPLRMKEPEEETSSPDGASGSSIKVHVPTTRAKTKLLAVKEEEMDIDVPSSLDGMGITNAPEDWSVMSRRKKRPREGPDGHIDLTQEEGEGNEEEEEMEDATNESDQEPKTDELSHHL